MSQSTEPNRSPLELLPRLLRSWWELAGLAFLLLVVVAGAFWLAWQFVQPAPPQRVVLAAGARGGAYWQFAESYARTFADAGIELELRETAGAAENYQLLLDRSSGVDAALVQGGTAPPGAPEHLLSVCAIDLEPIWVFHRDEIRLSRLRDLAGRRVAIGVPGSGTHHVAITIFDSLGIPIRNASDEHGSPDAIEVIPVGGREAIERLRAGTIDAAVFVASTRSPLIVEALAVPGVSLFSMERTEAIARNHPFVQSVRLVEGVLDLKRNLPPKDVPLIAVTAGIAVHHDTHPSVVQLLVQAALATHRDGSAVVSAGDFPTSYFPELPSSEVAVHQLRMGPNWLQRHLPFWAASLVGRLWVLAVPLLTLAIPLLRFSPGLLRWRVRARIYRWYKRVRRIDELARAADSTPEELRSARDELRLVHARVSALNVPLSYADALYQLRLHIRFVEEGLDKRLSELR